MNKPKNSDKYRKLEQVLATVESATDQIMGCTLKAADYVKNTAAEIKNKMREEINKRSKSHE